MQDIEKKHHERAKKEAKRLLMLARETNGSIPVSTLAQAQKAIAFLRGKESWHELESSALRPGSQGQHAEAPREREISAVEMAGIISEALRQTMGEASIGHRAIAVTTGNLAMASGASGKRRGTLEERFSGSASGLECAVGNERRVWIPLLGSPSGTSRSTQWICAKPEMRPQALLADALRLAGKAGDPRSFVSFSATNRLDDCMREACQGGEIILFGEGKNGRFPVANPFDTHPGARAPSSAERTALLDLLGAICHPELDFSGRHIFSHAIDACYLMLASPSGAKPYCAGILPDVDKALAVHGLGPATWWDASDALGEAGMPSQAWKAQAMAMPTLADAIVAIQSESSSARKSVHANILTRSGATAASAAIAALKECEAQYPEMAKPSQWAPKKTPRGISFNLKSSVNADQRGIVLRLLWARKISQRWMPALAGAGALRDWQTIDVGSGAGAGRRRRDLAAQFKKAGKDPKCVVIVNDMPSLQWGALAEAIKSDMEQARHSGNAMTVLDEMEPSEIFGSISLTVKAKELSGGGCRLEVRDDFEGKIVSGECVRLSSPSEAWATSTFASDRALVEAAKRHKDPETALAAIFCKYPAGSWQQEAEEAAGDLPWDALSEEEQQELAALEVARATGLGAHR